jgi:type I restriction-modification system DNA methylase subunit
LHDRLKDVGYTGHDLEVYLVRLLFCLFADDTSIFNKGIFWEYVDRQTKEDGSDLGMAIAMLFQVLNTAHDKRQTNLDEALKAFEYVNGSLFAEYIQTPYFDFDLRTNLLRCVEIDWSGISPAIFGSMFQSVLEYGTNDTAHRKESRRELGAHYTSERNILKVIQPLFLDELYEEFEKAKGKKAKLTSLYEKLSTLNFLDPACGCGNFLVIAYREIRRIENDVINELFFKGQAQSVQSKSVLSREDVEEAMVTYMERAFKEDGCPWYAIARHMLGLYHAERGGRLWRQVWSNHKLKPQPPREVMQLAREALARGAEVPA